MLPGLYNDVTVGYPWGPPWPGTLPPSASRALYDAITGAMNPMVNGALNGVDCQCGTGSFASKVLRLSCPVLLGVLGLWARTVEDLGPHHGMGPPAGRIEAKNAGFWRAVTFQELGMK